MKSGVFKLDLAAFDPAETFKLICDVFRPQAASKRIEISYEIDSNLKAPEEIKQQVSFHLPVLMSAK